MKLARFTTTIAMAVACAPFLLAGPAAAARPAPAGDDVATNASVGVMADGCSNYACIEAGLSSPNAGWVRAYFHTLPSLPRSHFHFWGPGFDFNTPSRTNYPYAYTPWYGPYRPGKYCVELWHQDSFGVWHTLGLPCVTI